MIVRPRCVSHTRRKARGTPDAVARASRPSSRRRSFIVFCSGSSRSGEVGGGPGGADAPFLPYRGRTPRGYLCCIFLCAFLSVAAYFYITCISIRCWRGVVVSPIWPGGCPEKRPVGA